MKLQKRTWIPIDYLDESLWQGLLDRYQFWRDSGGVVNFVLTSNGQSYWPEVKAPQEIFTDFRVQSLIGQWLKVHENLYGPGRPISCGLLCVPPYVESEYRVDGSTTDANNQIGWGQIAQAQGSHLTIMPLRVNPYDQFMIAGMPVRMTPGLFFEFNNTLPHAFFNRGDEHTVLLVTTWAADSDILQHSLVNFQ